MYRDSVAHGRLIVHGLLNIDRVSIKWTSGVQRMYHHNSVSQVALEKGTRGVSVMLLTL